MSALTGNLISDSYHGLLKTANNGALTTTLTAVTDGDGNATPLSISTTAVSLSGSIQITGSLVIDSFSDNAVATLLPESLVVGNAEGSIGVYTDMHGIELYSGSNYLDITVDGNNFGDYVAGTAFTVADNTGNPHVVMQFQNHDNWTDGNIDMNVPVTFHSGSTVSGYFSVVGLSNYANDTAAALGGVPVNGFYRSGSIVMVRVS